MQMTREVAVQKFIEGLAKDAMRCSEWRRGCISGPGVEDSQLHYGYGQAMSEISKFAIG